MEESFSRVDMHGNVVRLSSLRPLKSTLSGRSTPRGSPSFRRLHSSRTPRREGRVDSGCFQCIRGNRLVFWLLLITLWTYLAFYIQSTWAHNNDTKKEFIGYESKSGKASDADQIRLHDKVTNVGLSFRSNTSGAGVAGGSKKTSGSMKLNMDLGRKKKTRKNGASRKRRNPRKERNLRINEKSTLESESSEFEEEIPRTNNSFGLLLGPFDKTEDRILEWSIEKRSGTCDRKGNFARLVWSRKFVLIFHELSLTGAPLSMMELASELLSCGATVSAVALSKKGGLMEELNRRGIKVMNDKAALSYKMAMKADLVIAGSAVCASWIEEYLDHSTATSSLHIVWWIMENRREYFDRAKHVLNRVKMLIFLSEMQSKQWLAWCEEELISLKSQTSLVPLSVNDELAFVAGFHCSLNTPSFTVEKMLEKKRLLRNAVRNEMGLTDNDMLVMSLSSINSGKGQRLILDSALMVVAQTIPPENSTSGGLPAEGNVTKTISGTNDLGLHGKQGTKTSLQNLNEDGQSSNGTQQGERSVIISNVQRRKSSRLLDRLRKRRHGQTVAQMRRMLSVDTEQKQNFRVLIGSVGSKSNKVQYINGILQFISQHFELSKLILWTPASTRVASLYAAADVFVINAQGLGETFGRVTIEAMAFGLPVLGTDAGGTVEIVEHNVTGFLHPVGHLGVEVLARNLQFLLHNPLVREQMGMRGKGKVEKMYLKNHMYNRLAKVFYQTMKTK